MKTLKTLKTALLIATLIASQSALSDIGAGTTSFSTPESTIEAPGMDWSKAKDNCKKLGGSWKPIRQICKIDSITIEGL